MTLSLKMVFDVLATTKTWLNETYTHQVVTNELFEMKNVAITDPASGVVAIVYTDRHTHTVN